MKEKPKDHVVFNAEYVTYLTEAIQSIIDDGLSLPAIKKATNGTHKFQVTGHVHIADALQGYWERNRKVYTHRAKSDYRALYLGTILMLEEEKLLTGRDNDEVISKLRTWLELKQERHKILQQFSLIRQEIKTMLAEMENEVLSEDEFRSEVISMVETFETKDERVRISMVIDKMIEEEQGRMASKKRQRRHREFEKLSKGMQLVEDE